MVCTTSSKRWAIHLLTHPSVRLSIHSPNIHRSTHPTIHNFYSIFFPKFTQLPTPTSASFTSVHLLRSSFDHPSIQFHLQRTLIHSRSDRSLAPNDVIVDEWNCLFPSPMCGNPSLPQHEMLPVSGKYTNKATPGVDMWKCNSHESHKMMDSLIIWIMYDTQIDAFLLMDASIKYNYVVQ